MSKYINEFAERWLQTLESGEYKQGTDYLCRDGAYCCLGVAEDLAGSVQGGYIHAEGVVTFNGESEVLSTVTKERLGMKDTGGSVDFGEDFDIEGKTYTSIVQANDTGRTFLEIANVIRENPEKFFETFEVQNAYKEL